MSRLWLKIEPVIRNAEDLKHRLEREMPHHNGLISLAAGVAAAAREAERAAKQIHKPFGIHRLPVVFLALALLMLFGWTYIEFFHTTQLKIALPDRDAHELRNRVKEGMQLKLEPVIVPGSREAADLVTAKKVDLAFVQGGVEVSKRLPRMETANPEIILWFVRDSVQDLRSIRRVMTSLPGAGSHSVAIAFMKAWSLDSHIEFVHDWVKLTDEKGYVVPETVDAIFVVKDPADEKTLHAADRLANEGFRLRSTELGARQAHMDYVRPYAIPVGFLRAVPPFPAEPVNTYSVTTFLIARENLTPRMLSAASHLLDGNWTSMSEGRYEPTLSDTSELIQGVDAFLGIIINIVLAFLALMGLEMLFYRKRFHELNSLVSLISVYQSSKDIFGVKDASIRRDHLLYLSLCSDLLGLVSMVSGYYTQENSSLLFSGMPEIIHQRCDGLKINIQLKILHATISLEDVMQVPASESAGHIESKPVA